MTAQSPRMTWLVLVVASVLCLSACGAENGTITPANSPSGPDYARNAQANLSASQAIEQYEPSIESDRSFGGIAIVESGIRVDVAGSPSPVLNAAITGMRKLVPVKTRTVPNSLKVLKALTVRLNHDSTSWTKKGIVMSSWGSDEESNTVQVALTHYRPAAAKRLVAKYGAGVLTVSTKSETVEGS